jgi:hypothetical protein
MSNGVFMLVFLQPINGNYFYFCSLICRYGFLNEFCIKICGNAKKLIIKSLI